MEIFNDLNNKDLKMNTCLIAYTFYEVDFRVRRYAEALVKAGHHVDVFALKRTGQNRREELNGVDIYHLQKRDFNEKGLGSYLLRMVLFFVKVFLAVAIKHLRYRYTIVHFHNPPDFLVFSALIPKLSGAKIIFDMHENLPEFYCTKFNKDSETFLVKVLLLLEKAGIRFADFTIVAHDLLRERVIKRDGVPADKCVALLNYPSKEFFNNPLQEKNDKEFTLVYPGTISYQNGIDIVIRAMAVVKQECKSARLEIYGAPRSQKYYQELIKLIGDLGLNGSVTFRGVVPFEEIGSILKGANIGVVPKRGGIFGSEAFSTKILEFMAAGLPVIASRTKIDEYYFDDSTVKFFEPENHTDLARCIVELWRSPEKRESLAKKGVEFVELNNWESKSQTYLWIVDNLLKK